MLFKWLSEPRFPVAYPAGLAELQGARSVQHCFVPKTRRSVLLAYVIAVITGLTLQSGAQSPSPSGAPWSTGAIRAPAESKPNYDRPTQRTRVNNYIFDAFGPYPLAGAALAAGTDQLSNSPPEWNRGAEGFGKRFGSDFAIETIDTTTRYGLAETFREDTLYYRCECAGPFPRLRHAVISTFTGRRGVDGHRVFSFPALAAPYAGSMIAVYGWYPNRFGAQDAFRMGNYSLLGYVGGNVILEFFYSGPHAVISRSNLKKSHGAPDPGPNQ